MNFLDKLRENLSQISFLKKKKVSVFINVRDKNDVENNNIYSSNHLNEMKSLYISATKIYKPKFFVMYIFGTIFLKKKKGFQRVEKSIPRFKILELYKEFLDGKNPSYDNCKIIFEDIGNKPDGLNEDEHRFQESN